MFSVCILTAPCKEPNLAIGDYHYAVALNEILNARGNDILTSAILDIPQADAMVSVIKKQKNSSNIAENTNIDMQEIFNFAEQLEADRLILEYFNDKPQPWILNLHLRLPDTGAAIIPQQMQKLRAAGVYIFTTCHEYDMRSKKLRAYTNEYLKNSDKIWFFNMTDLDFADRLLPGIRNKSSITHVPITVPSGRMISFSTKLPEQNNYLTFGNMYAPQRN